MPRIYGLAVVGITGSALLSIAVGDPSAAEPWARMLDTGLGCAIVFVVGVVLWPRRGLPDQRRTFGAAAEVLARLIDVGLRLDAAPAARAVAADEAYRRANAWRADLERDLAEPDLRHTAAAWLPVAIQLEGTIDAVCASLARARATPGGPLIDVRAELTDLLRGRSATPASAARLLTAIVTGPRHSAAACGAAKDDEHRVASAAEARGGRSIVAHRYCRHDSTAWPPQPLR